MLRMRWGSVTLFHASCITEMLSILSSTPCDAVIIDSHTPGFLECIETLNAMVPKIRVIVKSRQTEPIHGLRALQAGGCAYWREGDQCDLVLALEQVLAGRQYISASLEHRLAKTAKLANPGSVGLSALTPRERQVFDSLSIGHSLKEIAVLLNISTKTVSTFRTRVLEKMHFHDGAELLRYSWSRQGLGGTTPEPAGPPHASRRKKVAVNHKGNPK
jgi:two-component system invasion response regulator UvrY